MEDEAHPNMLNLILQDDSDRKAAIHTRGCFKAVTSILHDNVIVVGGVIIGILVPQVRRDYYLVSW